MLDNEVLPTRKVSYNYKIIFNGKWLKNNKSMSIML